MTDSQPPTLQTWLMAARPRTLPAAAAPVFVAIAFALRDGVFHWPSALACLLISLLMQIGANFANDLFDHERGTAQLALVYAVLFSLGVVVIR